MAERADDRELSADERGIRGEHQIRNVRPRLDTLDLDVARTVQHFDEAIPLPSGIRRRCADVARHPRVTTMSERSDEPTTSASSASSMIHERLDGRRERYQLSALDSKWRFRPTALLADALAR